MEEATPPRRRWFQFGVGELLQAILLLALSAGGVSYLIREAASVPLAILSLFFIPFGPCAAIGVLAGDRKAGLITGTYFGVLLVLVFLASAILKLSSLNISG